jgi:hypothetical protein
MKVASFIANNWDDVLIMTLIVYAIVFTVISWIRKQ